MANDLTTLLGEQTLASQKNFKKLKVACEAVVSGLKCAMTAPALHWFSRFAAIISWRRSPAIAPAIPRSTWLSGILPRNVDKSQQVRIKSVVMAAVHACAHGPLSARESLADQLGRNADGCAYSNFRLLRAFMSQPDLPSSASQIGMSVWSCMFLEWHIPTQDDFLEAVGLPPETHSSQLPHLRSALKSGARPSRQCLGIAVGVLFVAEAIERPDLLLQSQDYMPAWAKRLSLEAMAIAESISIKEAIVLAPGDSSLPATGLRRTLRL